MKKLLLSAFLLGSLAGFAQTFQSGDFTYTVTSTTEKTVDLAKPSKAYAIADAVIPETVTNDGVTYTVTGIAPQAFMSNATLKTIKMPNTIKTIGAKAFQSCTVLTTVDMGNSVETIEENAFYTVRTIIDLKLSPTVKIVGKWALRGLSALKTLDLGRDLERLGDGVCWGNTALKGVTIPDKCTYIGENAFASCSAIDSIQLGESIDTLAIKAFAYVSNCKKVICRASVPPVLMDEKSMVSTYTKTSLWVKEKSLATYQKTAPWSSFTEIKAYDPSGSADDMNFVMAGVAYDVISKENLTVAVAHNDTVVYKGEVMVRPTVDYAGNTYNVIGVQPNAFKNCTELTQIELPTGIASIGDNAFNGCSGLKYFVIKATTVPTLGATVFTGIDFAKAKLYAAQAAVANYKTAAQWKDFTNLTIVIDEATIDGCTYKCNDIIASTLDFTGAKGAKGNLVLPDVVMIDGYPFTITNIAGNAFYNTDLTDLTLPATLKTISGNAFFSLGAYNNPIKKIVVPEGVTSIGSNAFYGAYVKNVELPKYSLTNLANSAFYSCNIEGIAIPGSVGVINASTFYASKMQWVTLGEGITEIKDNAFASTNIGSLRLPSTMKTIGANAFWACSILSSLTINDGLEKVDASSFSQDRSLYKVFSFAKKMPEGLVAALEDSGSSIGNERTTYSVSDILTNGVAFGKVSVRPDLDTWFDYDGVRYLPAEAGSTNVLAVDASYNVEDKVVKLPKTFSANGKNYTVTSAANYLLCGQSVMQSAEITYPFVDLPNGFVYNATKLKSITIPSTVQTLGAYCFANTDSLDKVDLPDALTTIGLASFYYAGIKELTVPSKVTLMDNASVSGCKRLNKITFKDGTANVLLGWFPTMFGNRPLFNGSKLDTVVIGRNLTYYGGASYGYSPFYGDSILQHVTITDGATSIGSNLFLDCKGMRSVAVGNGVTNIGSAAFSGCASLDSVFLGEALTMISQYAFNGCTKVTKLYSGNVTPPKLGQNIFADIDTKTCVLFVPKPAISAYKAAEQWKEFYNIQEFAFVGVESVINENETGRFIVYNLNGVCVLDTCDESLVNNLPSGLYIINGKKVIK